MFSYFSHIVLGWLLPFYQYTKWRTENDIDYIEDYIALDLSNPQLRQNWHFRRTL